MAFGENDKKRLLSAKYLDRNKGLDSYKVVEQNYERFRKLKPDGDILQEMIYFDLMFRLPELLLMRVDKITMSQSIEARVPFLDHKLAEFSMAIPTAIKIAGDIPKFVLRKAVEDIIPNNIINRKKTRVCSPSFRMV